ncbi:hypothetical protein TNCV_4583631 [Trichonephila clavipes]|nr:hypothetical protein TNCV_4583631 [Trichonephila clavipes]
MVLKANDRRTSCPCHDEFRGPRSDYVRQQFREDPHFKPIRRRVASCSGSSLGPKGLIGDSPLPSLPGTKSAKVIHQDILLPSA